MTTHYLNGAWQPGRGARFESLNPCTQQPIWSGLAANEDDVSAAVDSARQASSAWASQSFEHRCDVVKRYQLQLIENKQRIAETIALETGKPIWESLTEAAAMAGKIDISIRAFLDRTGESNRDLNGATGRVRHRPHGVVAVFGPYNFPGHLPNGHIVPALLAGNTVVLKPSEQTPLVAQTMLQLWEQAGLPPGVINLVQGEKDTGIALAKHAELDGIFFTGSSSTGAILEKQLSGTGKILALEMGGNNPLVVWDVADVNAAVYHILQSAYLTAGQRCTCARRMIVPTDSLGDRLVDQLQQAIDNIIVGPPSSTPEPFMGPLISNAAADQLLNAQQRLQDLGGHVLVDLKRVQPDLPFLSPGLIDMTDAQNVTDEEHFGPLLTVYRAKDFGAAIELANNTRFGLSAGLLSDRRDRWDTFQEQIKAGIINWNRPLTGASGSAPFGGIGASGNHRPSAYYAADYCAYPVAMIENEQLKLPETQTPGLKR